MRVTTFLCAAARVNDAAPRCGPAGMKPIASLAPRRLGLDLRYLLVLLCFLASGFAGLLYQTAWSREFSFVFGTSNLAVATVLAAYMGGLSLGAMLAARFMHRIRRPVLAYGLLELGIAASALAVPVLIRAVSSLYRPLFLSASILPEEGGLASALFYGAASFAILGIPTTLMGATLPMLARHAVRERSQIGGRIGALYAVNTAGAIAGTIATAFLLLPALGLRATVWVGAALNAAVFAAAALLARRAPPLAAEPARPREPGAPAGALLTVAFVSSVASFLYENLWFRLFEHVLGASIYAFSTMLAGFLLGISLGGALAAPLARTRAGSARGLAATQLGAAAFSVGAFLLVDGLPAVASRVNELGLLGVLARASVAAALLLPSTLCIGASFPFAVRALADRADVAAAASARVYGWNTLGAIVGSLAAGFVVIPALGFERTLVATALLNVFAGALAAAAVRPVAKPALACAAAAALALLFVRPATPWRVVGTAPLGLDTWSGATGNQVDPERVVFYAVGRSSTVLLADDADGWRLRTNGLPEATIEKPGVPPGNSATARWLTMLPAFAPAAPRDLLVIGFGGGVAVEQVPVTFERIDVVELEPEVIDASRTVAALRNRDPLADPRLRVLLNDARGALTLTDLRYGAIVSQPSHPWTAGASHLYTRDFFAQVRERLAPGGVFVQWMGLQFVDETLFRTLLATLLDVFPHLRLYQADSASVLFVASAEPLDLERQVEATVRRDPDGFAQLGVRVPEDLAVAFVLDEAGAHALAAGAPLATDDHNLLATHSPRILSRPIGKLDRLLASHDPLFTHAAGLDAAYLVQRLVEREQTARAERLAKSLEDPLQRLLAETELALGRKEPRKALGLAERALALDPSSHRARDRVDALSFATGAGGPVAEGRRLREARDWDALARLDAALAGVDARDPSEPEAGLLRIDWRLGAGSAEAAREALALIDRTPSANVERLARRALAGARSGSPGVAGRSLDAIGKRLGRGRLSPLAVEWALAALDGAPAGELPAGAAALRARIVRAERTAARNDAR
jgi:spermidine synthase